MGLSLVASARLIRGSVIVVPEAGVAAFMFGQDSILEGLWRDPWEPPPRHRAPDRGTVVLDLE